MDPSPSRTSPSPTLASTLLHSSRHQTVLLACLVSRAQRPQRRGLTLSTDLFGSSAFAVVQTDIKGNIAVRIRFDLLATSHAEPLYDPRKYERALKPTRRPTRHWSSSYSTRKGKRSESQQRVLCGCSADYLSLARVSKRPKPTPTLSLRPRLPRLMDLP